MLVELTKKRGSLVFYHLFFRIFLFPEHLPTSVQRSEEFHSGTGRDGIEVQSRDPGIFRDGISLIFSSRDFLEIVRDFSGLTFFDAISDYLE